MVLFALQADRGDSRFAVEFNLFYIKCLHFF